MGHVRTTASESPLAAYGRSTLKEFESAHWQLMHQIEQKFPSCLQSAEKLFLSRSEKMPLHCFGDVIPFVFYDIAQVSPDARRKISVGWLALCLCIFSIDETIDTETNPPDPLIVPALLIFAMSNLVGTTGQSSEIQKIYLNLLSALDAAKTECGLKLQDKTQDELLSVARLKNAAYTSLAYACLIESRSADRLTLTKVADHLGVPFQLLDDLLDIEEDLEQNHVTWPISLLPLEVRDKNKLSLDHYFNALAKNNNLSIIIQVIAENIEAIVSVLKQMPSCSTSKALAMFQEYQDQCTALLELARRAEGAIGEGDPQSALTSLRIMIERLQIIKAST
jgi:hypothetical protein